MSGQELAPEVRTMSLTFDQLLDADGIYLSARERAIVAAKLRAAAHMLYAAADEIDLTDDMNYWRRLSQMKAADEILEDSYSL